MPLTELTVNQGDAGAEPWPVAVNVSSVATRTTVAASVTEGQLLPANPNRSVFTIYNDSGKVLFLILGGVGSTTDYTTQLTSKAYFELSGYTGEVRGVWNGTGGFARITELTI
jgi:hypothetical protein